MNVHNLKPVFDFTSADGRIFLCTKPVEIKLNNTCYTGVGEATLDLSPTPWIRIYCTFKNVSLRDIFSANQEAATLFSMDGQKIQGIIGRQESGSAKNETHITWMPSTSVIPGRGDDSTSMNWLVAHIFNFVEFSGTEPSTETIGNTKCNIHRAELFHDDWQAEITSTVFSRDNHRRLREKGGYQLTHMVGIRKCNDKSFSGKDASYILDVLFHFLSFANGLSCSPVCSVGFDDSERCVWEEWSIPGNPWKSRKSWFSGDGSQLSNLFPGFMARWAEEGWRETLRHAIYWYLLANNSSQGADTGLVLSQVALERLAFELAVRDVKLLSSEGFTKLRASDRLRLLFSTLRIPLDIPVQCTQLMKLSGQSKKRWDDAPHALTEIRNSVIHPENSKTSGMDDIAYYEAWNLALWYLEMSILAICKYNARYRNRVTSEFTWEKQTVPWSPE